MSETWNRVKAVLDRKPRPASIKAIIDADGSGRLHPEAVYLSLKFHADKVAGVQDALESVERGHLQDKRVEAVTDKVAKGIGLVPVAYKPAKRKRLGRPNSTGKTAATEHKRAQREARKAAERASQSASGKGGKGK